MTSTFRESFLKDLNINPYRGYYCWQQPNKKGLRYDLECCQWANSWTYKVYGGLDNTDLFLIDYKSSEVYLPREEALSFLFTLFLLFPVESAFYVSEENKKRHQTDVSYLLQKDSSFAQDLFI